MTTCDEKAVERTTFDESGVNAIATLPEEPVDSGSCERRISGKLRIRCGTTLPSS
jgi:hypothetical protein